MRIVLLSKLDRFSKSAQAHARNLWPDVEIADGRGGDPRPEGLQREGDVLISFLAPWIITAEELDRFGTAINFHPASVDYPGSGCYNFALYEEAREYGATCHHMLPKVDTGAVILERRFPLFTADTVETLKLRTMATMLTMFYEITDLIAAGKPLPSSPAHWTREPNTFRKMEALRFLTEDMSACEVRRRTRAMIYPGYPGPVLMRRDGGHFVIPVPARAALA